MPGSKSMYCSATAWKVLAKLGETGHFLPRSKLSMGRCIVEIGAQNSHPICLYSIIIFCMWRLFRGSGRLNIFFFCGLKYCSDDPVSLCRFNQGTLIFTKNIDTFLVIPISSHPFSDSVITCGVWQYLAILLYDPDCRVHCCHFNLLQKINCKQKAGDMINTTHSLLICTQKLKLTKLRKLTKLVDLLEKYKKYLYFLNIPYIFLDAWELVLPVLWKWFLKRTDE
jgi:hypothetical protein